MKAGLLKKRKARMGKNNSVKKIDEEQILKRFEYTVQEYIRFYDFYKNQEVSEENTEAFYVMLQTKLMILRKYDYNREDVYLSNVFDAIDKMYPEVGENINILREKFEKLNNYYMEVILSDGTSLNLYKAIEDVMYAFSNAVAYLKRNSYIEPTGVKGSYRVIKKKSKSVDESTEEFKTLNKELELKEMREKVKKCVRETYLELEKILDEEKPSVYGRNKHTYEDVTTLIEYMRKFDFIVEE